MAQLPLITTAFLNLTNACNLACKYCFVHQNPQKITLQTAKDAADWLANNAAQAKQVPNINFFGGEPMLMWDEIIVPLTLYIREKYNKNFSLGITSNCVLMTEDRAHFMRENGIGLLFSIDGDKPTQDNNRPTHSGGSSFDILKDKIPIILKYFPNVTFRSTAVPETCGNMFHDIMFAEKQGFKNYFIIPNCFEEWSKDKVAILHEQMDLYTDHYIDSFREGKIPILFSQLEKKFKVIVEYNQAIRSDSYRDLLKCKACGRCGIGSSKGAAININGDVITCQEMFSNPEEKFIIGNIYTGIDEARRKALMDEYDSAPIVGDHCSTCQLNRICDGGCAINNYFANGDMHIKPAILCEWDRLLFDKAAYIMTTLGEEKNELFKGRWMTYVR